MSLYDSGLLLLTSDFRKTFVTRQQSANGETEQIRKALVNFRYTCLDEKDKQLLAHDLTFIFTKLFYDFDHGCLLAEKSLFFRSDETLFFFADYLLYFSFISTLYERPSNADAILNDTANPESRKLLFSALREPLSPYLFITFIHNLIDTINLGTQVHDTSSIENEMCRQLMINAKELSQLNKFIELHKKLLEKVKIQFKTIKKIVTKEMENTYTLYFGYAFYQTLVYPSEQFKDPDFKEMTKNLFKIQYTNKSEMDPIIESFAYEKDLLSFHTYLYQRAMCIGQENSWVHSSSEKENFLYPAQLRLTIISKKIGELMSDNAKPIGNTVVIVIIPVDQKEYQNITINFQYNGKSYAKKIVEGLIDCVFPCFKDSKLEISFSYKNKSKNKSSENIVIDSMQNPPDHEIMKDVKFGNKKISVVVSAKFFNHDKPLEDLVAHINTNPKKLFDFVAEAFLHKYFTMNSQFIYVHRGEDEFEDDAETAEDGTENLFKTTNNLRITQDFSGRAFPDDFWLFLIDIAIKYSIPSSYFFSRLTDKLNKCWCTAQAYINIYCIILYNLYYAINNSEHTEEEELLFKNTMKTIKEKCVHLLMSQLAKPEIYQRSSITSLILLLSLSNDGDEKSLGDLLKTIFLSSMNNITSSVYNLLEYEISDTECVSMDLFNQIKDKPVFVDGPNNLPLCNVTIESLKKALDLVLYRCRSISSFYLESFLPSFANIGDNIINDLKTISISIAKAFDNIESVPDQKELVYFVTIYQQLYQLSGNDKELNPAVLFNDSIEKWMFDLSTSMIDLVERSIKFDTFEKRSEKSRTSDSFIEIFMFFRQGFDFITSLNFTQEEIKYKLFFFLSIDAALLSTYIDFLLSMASKQFRNSFNQPVQIIAPKIKKSQDKPKSFFPSWCPDITETRVLSFENICVMVNNVALIRQKWFKYIIIYDKYLPNQPQIAVALKATSDRRSAKSDRLSTNLLLNENESSEELTVESKDTFKDPCHKLTTKVTFMINFLRLDLTYAVIGLLNKKMWNSSLLNKMMIKQLRESFFVDNISSDGENITAVFDKILDEFKERIQKVKDFMQISLHLKCIPQLVRGLEDGIFECMIPLAFSTKSKNIFLKLTTKIDALLSDAFNSVEEAGFGKEIVNRSVKALRFMPYIRNFIHMTPKEVEEELKKEKSISDNDCTNNIILLNIVLQSITPVPLPKAVNPNYTFITLE